MKIFVDENIPLMTVRVLREVAFTIACPNRSRAAGYNDLY